MRLHLLLLAFALGLTSELIGQEPSGLCFRAGPKARCTSYLALDFGIGVRTSAPPDEEPYFLSGNIGWMLNVSQRVAIGVSGFALAFGDNDPYADTEWFFPNLVGGLDGRARYWLSSAFALEADVGFAFVGDKSPAPTVQIQADYQGWVGAFVRYTRLQTSYYWQSSTQFENDLSVGIQVHSWPALFGQVLATLLGLNNIVGYSS